MEKIRKIFSEQLIMNHIGARLSKVEPGKVDIEIGYEKYLTQQNGFIHAGIVTTICDSACGYAAYSLMPEGADVLTVEFKVNLLSPALGDKFLAEGRILRAGRKLTVAQGSVFAFKEDKKKQIATMLATIMCIQV